MIFYKRMIGDIQSKTGALSCAEMGIYDRFLDHYYSLEEPLPNDLDECCRIARAMTKDERKGVERVLAKFFTLTARGYEQSKAEEMIAEAQPKIAASRANGAKGGRPKQAKTVTQPKPTGLILGTQEEPTGQASQSQSQINTKEVSLSHSPHPDERDPDFEKPGGTTQAGEVCKALKRLGMGSVSPGHPELLALIKKGVTIDMFEDAATKSVAKQRGFAYMLAIVKGQMSEAAAIEAGPVAPVAKVVPDAAEITRKMLDESATNAVPPPPNVRAKMAALTAHLKGQKAMEVL